MNGVNFAAFFATTISSAASIAATVALTKAESTNEKIALVGGGLLGFSLALGSTTAWLRSDSKTSTLEYLSNAIHDSGVAMSGLITSVAGSVLNAAVVALQEAVRDNVYETLRGKPKKEEKVNN